MDHVKALGGGSIKDFVTTVLKCLYCEAFIGGEDIKKCQNLRDDSTHNVNFMYIQIFKHSFRVQLLILLVEEIKPFNARGIKV